MTLVNVALAVGIDGGFTYRLPDALSASPGARVLVPFGTRRLIGVIRPDGVDAQDVPPDKLREVIEVLDEAPVLSGPLLALTEWISDYYLAPVGESYRAALPGSMTGKDLRVLKVEDPSWQPSALPTYERRIYEAVLVAGALEVAALSRISPKVPAALRRAGELCAAGRLLAVWPDAELETRVETFVRRTDLLREASGDAALADIVGRSKKRRAVLDVLEQAEGWVALSDLRAEFPRVRELIRPLVDAHLLTIEERPVALDPFARDVGPPTTPPELTSEQQHARAELTDHLGAFHCALLHGITGSGKTEVYLGLIASALERGQGAIVLVPEIALTPQLADRFRARFGDAVAVLHSGLTPRQRLDAWSQIAAGHRRIVIGPRSAVFAPVGQLGVIVVDEEHDPSFKQEEGVRYHGRDVAVMRAKLEGAVCVLGSATPSLESFAHATRDRYAYLRLRERPTPRPLPTVELLSLKTHRPDPDTLLSGRLLEAVRETVAAGEQCILFLNRRGFNTVLQCEGCGSFVQCPDCSAPSLTYHLKRNRLVCHLCGHIEAARDQCGECGEAKLAATGSGTERIETGIQLAIPQARVLRLDRDTSRGRKLEQLLTRFRDQEADVLVGTQMLSKGHDFPNVTLVGVLAADRGLALPDLRASERVFSLLTQVAGRAGRGDRPGRVLIQAWDVEHPAIAHAARHDYEAFAEGELGRRRPMSNPPFGHLCTLRVQGEVQVAVQDRSRALANEARRLALRVKDGGGASVEVLGPASAIVERVNRRYRWQVLLRCEDRRALRWVLQHLRSWLGPHGTGRGQTGAVADVDPA